MLQARRAELAHWEALSKAVRETASGKMATIVRHFREGAERDLVRRQRWPGFPHGPTYQAMVDAAQSDPEYRVILENLKLLWDDMSEDDLKIIAWNRWDRKRLERSDVGAEAKLKKGLDKDKDHDHDSHGPSGSSLSVS